MLLEVFYMQFLLNKCYGSKIVRNFCGIEKKFIVELHKDGKSLRDIGGIIKRSHSTIQYVIKKYKESGSVKKKLPKYK